MIDIKQIFWIAGFLEGEGSFTGRTPKNRCAIVSATQVQLEPISRLQSLLGGKIRSFSRKEVTGNIYHRWELFASRAIGLMFTIYQLMSPKRQSQILKVINGWKAGLGQGGYNRIKTHCPKGHPYSPENTYINQNGKYKSRNCLICQREKGKNYMRRKRIEAIVSRF